MSELIYYSPLDNEYYSEFEIENEDNNWEDGDELWECETTNLPRIDLVDMVFNHINDYIEIDDCLPKKKELEQIENQLNEYLKTNFKYYKENKNRVIKFKDGKWIDVV